MATRSAKIDQKADLIWAIADKLTGVYKPHEYGDVILPLTVIRRFDCILSDTKDEITARSGDDTIRRIIMIPTSGFPDDRESAAVNSVVKDRASFVEYIAFVLGDDYVASIYA